ncbi:MAG TPA: helix-turn-helix domain-containing protein [Bacillales bacterium]|nr:helix-turn-helix domain-containing protein [Bacillales bacterium]
MNEQLTEVFKALAHPYRQSILDLLAARPMTTGEVSDHFTEVSRYAVMKHLNTLVEANLVVARKKGRKRYNYLNVMPLQMIKERWLNGYDSLMAESLLNVRELSENPEEEKIMAENLENQLFEIEQEVQIKAPRQDVFHALTHKINGWWSERLFKDSVMEVEPRLGGKFIETGEDGKAALWGMITYIVPDSEIWLDGNLGMPGPVKGHYQYKLEELDEGTTQLKLSHSVVGPHVSDWRKDYENGWRRLLETKLKDYLEK